jgi:hypothetical protein
MNKREDTMSKELERFTAGKSLLTLSLLDHFVNEFEKIGKIELIPAKTMIGVVGPTKRIAWITQLGKNFIHVVFPFKRPYTDNLCFQKIAQVPGDAHQFNHHFRMLQEDDVNDEVRNFMKIAFEGEVGL